MTLPRLNRLIAALERGRTAFGIFSPVGDIHSAVQLSTSRYDGVILEGEHVGWDVRGLRDCLQYLLDPARIAAAGSPAAGVTPIARIPANGVERNQFLVKQALDAGTYGIVFPHIATVEDAYAAVAACRYSRPKDRPLYEPAGRRGDGPFQAARYWGVDMAEYYRRADVWPLAKDGELLVVIQIESVAGAANLRDIVREVPGIGIVLIGEGDLAQDVGYPRQGEHPAVVEVIDSIAAVCHEAGVVVGHPKAEAGNLRRLIDGGFRYLMCAAPRSFEMLDAARTAAGRRKGAD